MYSLAPTLFLFALLWVSASPFAVNNKEFSDTIVGLQKAEKPGLITRLEKHVIDAIFTRLRESCGDVKVSVGERYKPFLLSLPPKERKGLNMQLQHLCPECSLKATLRTYSGKVTLNELIESWSKPAPSQTPTTAGKWSSIPYYLDPLNPVSIHDVPLNAACPGTNWDDLGVTDFDLNLSRLWAGRANSRAYPAHQHSVPEGAVILMVQGTKDIVNWPASAWDDLKPVATSGKTHKDMHDDFFMVDPFRGDDYSGAVRMRAEAGDVVYIPCSGIHIVEQLEDVVALNFVIPGHDEPLGRHMSDKCSAITIQRTEL